jgi:hypothetical protein
VVDLRSALLPELRSLDAARRSALRCPRDPVLQKILGPEGRLGQGCERRSETVIDGRVSLVVAARIATPRATSAVCDLCPRPPCYGWAWEPAGCI